jgi:hypothetical protein
MANVVNFADVRRRTGAHTIFDDAHQMIEAHGSSAGLVAAIYAKDAGDARR